MKRILTNLLLASVIVLTSCSKEDDLLTPIPNPPNSTTTINDTTTNDTGSNGTDILEYSPDENLVIDNSGNIPGTLEGTKWRITYTSFYLNNRYPICPMPYDTLVSNEWYNMGEVYFSNQGDGYLETRTYLIDCAPYYSIHGVAHYEPLFNYTPLPLGSNSLLLQDYVDYSVKNNEIVINMVSGSSNWEYTITLQIVEQTFDISTQKHTLVLENNNGVHSEYTNAQGYPTHWDRNVRLELEKIN